VSARPNQTLVLAAMVFAVAMTFIDQTIVAIAIPDLQKDLGLTATGARWIINGYLLALSALFAFGGIAQAWIITFRVLQGATAALMFPAAVGIVVASASPWRSSP
jgi:MFS family permease